MDLSQHCQDKLYADEEVCGVQPGHASVAKILGNLLRLLLDNCLVDLLLLVELGVASRLLLQVLLVFLLQLLLLLARHDLKEAER